MLGQEPVLQFDECDVGLLGHPRPQGRVERRELLRRAATGGARGRLARGATATESLVNIRNTDTEHRRRRIIPTRADQNRYAQSRIPMDMMRQGCSTSLFHASQQWSTMSS